MPEASRSKRKNNQILVFLFKAHLLGTHEQLKSSNSRYILITNKSLIFSILYASKIKALWFSLKKEHMTEHYQNTAQTGNTFLWIEKTFNLFW